MPAETILAACMSYKKIYQSIMFLNLFILTIEVIMYQTCPPYTQQEKEDQYVILQNLPNHVKFSYKKATIKLAE